MKKMLESCLSAALLTTGAVVSAKALPPPQKTGGMTLNEALVKRQTIRKISQKPLPEALLSNLLWAANGFNRADKRTAPTARNLQEIELYYVCSEGCFFYDAKKHALNRIGTEKYAGVPTVVIVADTEKQGLTKFRHVDAGFVGQNIYLFAAANNLATVFKATFNEPKLRTMLQLPPHIEICYVQEIGFAE